MTTTDEVLAQLNDYDGDNIWEDVIYGLPGYDEDATNAVEHGASDAFVADGVTYDRRSGDDIWRARNLGGRPAVGPRIDLRFPADLTERVDALAGELDSTRSALIRYACEQLLAHPVVVYRLTGEVQVVDAGTEREGTSHDDLGYWDMACDGEDWETGIDDLLADHGYRRVGPWSSLGDDSLAQVVSTSNTEGEQ